MKILATIVVGAALAAAASAAALALTLTATPPTVVYGKASTLSGVLPSWSLGVGYRLEIL